ncbi:MAG: monovalent cation/H+ antiporter complex subunit F [Roseibacillus sp.]
MLAIASTLLIISLVMTLLRILTARTEVDKVIAIDVLSFELIALSIVLAFHDRNALPLQFAFVLSLLGFISTLILSRLFKTKIASS